MMKTASKAEVADLARQMVGPELDSAKDSIVSHVVSLSEPRIAALAARLAKLEERIDDIAKTVQHSRSAQLAELHSKVSIGDLERHSSGVYERIKALESQVNAVKAMDPVVTAAVNKLTQVEKSLSGFRDHVDFLRDGALETMLNDVREQAMQRDKVLYHRIEDLGSRTKAEITAEKAKLIQQFKESARITEERRESVAKLEERVDRALSKYGNAYTALLREFEALKAGIRIGKGE